MLGSVREDADDNDWRVLLVDKESMKILSASCRLFDVMEKGISGTLIFSFSSFLPNGGRGRSIICSGLGLKARACAVVEDVAVNRQPLSKL
jgi:hypothetical protein